MNKRKIIIATITIILIIIVISLIKMKSNDLMAVTTGSTGSLSNKSIGWGIKRNDNHEQPELGEKNKNLITEYKGIAMGSQDTKSIYLTFDEGYEAGYTEKILDILKENDVKAAFFITGHYLNSQPNLVKRMIDEGHIVGNHTVNHYSMPSLDDEKLKTEVMNLHSAVYEKFGYEMTYLRPPKGEYSERTLALTQNLGYTTVMWSFAYDDWNENKQHGDEYAKNKIISNMHNGAVILLHANSKDNINVLDEVIKTLKRDGYEFKPLSEFKN